MARLYARAAATAAALLLFLVFLTGGSAVAGPGHDHGHGSAPVRATTGPGLPRVVMTSELYELVGIYKDHRLRIYLDRRQDTAPVTAADVSVTLDNVTVKALPQPDGWYLVESDHLNDHKAFNVVVEIKDDAAADLLAGTLDTTELLDHHAGDPFGHDHAIHHRDEHTGSGDWAWPHHISDFANFVALISFAVGCGLGAVAIMVWRRPTRIQAGISVLAVSAVTLWMPSDAWAGPGHDHGHGTHEHGSEAANGIRQDIPGIAPDGRIFLPKPTQRLLQVRTRVLETSTAQRSERLIGRVIADPNFNGLVQSTIRGRIKPAAGGLAVIGQRVKAGDVLVHVEPAFEPIDASDVRQTAGDLEQKIAVLEARLARRSQLVRKNIARKASLEDIKIELEGLQARRKQLDVSRSLPETLVAPVSGIVADVRVVSGQVVNSSETLFHIVDPDNLWVEALAYDTGLRVSDRATGYTENDQRLSLLFVGRSRALQQQASVLQFRINDPPPTLSVGAPLTVLVETGQPVKGLILPKDAVTEAVNGQTVAYVREAPEWYRAVPVRTERLDGARIQVLAGLKAGDQVVVRGASLISQIR